MKSKELQTERLHLRRWQDSDREPFAELNADPEVMEFFPQTLARDASDALIDRVEAHFDEHGFGLWAVETVADGRFRGAVGLIVPSFESFFTPCVEVGWRIARDSWGHGYGIEAARAAVDFGFSSAGLREIVSFTVSANLRSLGLMQRLGMHHDPAETFQHPLLPEGHRLSRHLLHRLSQARVTGETLSELSARTRSVARPER